jgi:mRNA-degrading endonuclease RelE of RelBE toxin-antitoxin system
LPANGPNKLWPVRLTASAQRDLDDIPATERDAVVEELRLLEKDPLPAGKNLKKLRGPKRSVWRLRHGNYRILYHVEGGQVMVVRVVNRRDLERAAERLE